MSEEIHNRVFLAKISRQELHIKITDFIYFYLLYNHAMV
jgi:hypothetical protein